MNNAIWTNLHLGSLIGWLLDYYFNNNELQYLYLTTTIITTIVVHYLGDRI